MSDHSVETSPEQESGQAHTNWSQNDDSGECYILNEMLHEIEEDETRERDDHITSSVSVECGGSAIPDDELEETGNDDRTYKVQSRGVLAEYFLNIQNRISRKDGGYPSEYRRGTF
ncbi:hypothetical protein BDB00DRAFT_784733 [Zychaea mexicana]|uniref:uncharacterized protein n=1 Tax=Zychaea mexicana TaxID=64656 RepID=UPI0022FE6070|nr:uncharacterized protein BDB00DRAFT_784733 [Zychaea mexicana]KAI9497388.1 hypothetical protein BDB00DRAFT_784733 [Zychaea mexicana]